MWLLSEKKTRKPRLVGLVTTNALPLGVVSAAMGEPGQQRPLRRAGRLELGEVAPPQARFAGEPRAGGVAKRSVLNTIGEKARPVGAAVGREVHDGRIVRFERERLTRHASGVGDASAESAESADAAEARVLKVVQILAGIDDRGAHVARPRRAAIERAPDRIESFRVDAPFAVGLERTHRDMRCVDACGPLICPRRARVLADGDHVTQRGIGELSVVRREREIAYGGRRKHERPARSAVGRAPHAVLARDELAVDRRHERNVRIGRRGHEIEDMRREQRAGDLGFHDTEARLRSGQLEPVAPRVVGPPHAGEAAGIEPASVRRQGERGHSPARLVVGLELA